MSKQVEVAWTTVLDLEDDETVKDAAYIVKGILQDPYNQAWYITVIEQSGKRHIIDASDENA